MIVIFFRLISGRQNSVNNLIHEWSRMVTIVSTLPIRKIPAVYLAANLLKAFTYCRFAE